MIHLLWPYFCWTHVYMVSLTGRPFVELSYGTCRELFIFTHWTNYVSFAPFLFVIHVLIKIWRELFMGWIVGPLRTPAASLVARPNLPICLVSVWNRKEPERDKNTVWSFGEIHSIILVLDFLKYWQWLFIWQIQKLLL